MSLINVLPKEIEQKLAGLAEEWTALAQELRAEVAAVRRIREALQASLREQP